MWVFLFGVWEGCLVFYYLWGFLFSLVCLGFLLLVFFGGWEFFVVVLLCFVWFLGFGFGCVVLGFF